MPRPLDTRAFGGGGAIHTVEVSVIALTIFNAFSAGLVCILIVIDNLRYKKSWKKLAHERRTPFYLAIAIFVSSIVFGIREFVLMGSGIPFTSEVPVAPSQTCIALNETCWWAIWFPIVALAIRVFLMGSASIVKFNPFARRAEVIYLLMTIMTSIGLWIPSQFFPTAPCSSFVMVFSPDTNSMLGFVGVIVLSCLLLLIAISCILITWDTCRATMPRRRSFYLEFDSIPTADRAPKDKEIVAKKTIVCYTLGMFCQFACLLPNFAMTALSRYSPPAAFVASVFIHTPGIVLLLQYLFLRHECAQVHRTVTGKTFVSISEPLPTREFPRHSLSDTSMNSDDYTRKRRRPYTTYGGGGEYIKYLRRRTWDGNFDLSSVPVNMVRGDHTASGRRIPVRSPTLPPHSRSGSVVDIWRSSSVEKRPLSRRDSLGSAPPSRGSVQEKTLADKPPLRRTRSGSIFKENLDDDVFDKEENRPGSSDLNRPTSSKGKSAPRELTIQAQGPSVIGLRPVLLPPLGRDSGRSSRGSPLVPDLEDLSRPITSPPRSNSTSPKPRSILKSASGDQENRPTSSQSGFKFPFDPPATVRSQAIDYEEDYSDWRPKTPPSTNNLMSLPGPYTWPVGSEDLAEPDPPFASEDRHYMMSTPSDQSRLSTITEEGTIRESMVQTPTNIVLCEVLASMRESSSEEGSSRLSPIPMGMESRDSETPRVTSRLSIQPIPENPDEGEVRDANV